MKSWLVYRALTGMNGKTHLAIAARTAFINAEPSGYLKIAMSPSRHDRASTPP
jgi:hypothetical protein